MFVSFSGLKFISLALKKIYSKVLIYLYYYKMIMLSDYHLIYNVNRCFHIFAFHDLTAVEVLSRKESF